MPKPWKLLKTDPPTELGWYIFYGYGFMGPAVVPGIYKPKAKGAYENHFYFPTRCVDEQGNDSDQVEGCFYHDQSHFIKIEELTHWHTLPMPEPKKLNPELFEEIKYGNEMFNSNWSHLEPDKDNNISITDYEGKVIKKIPIK